MATPIVMQYQADSDTAIKSITAVIARLGYTLKAVDNQNGLITFETGMSMSSWAGQSMSVHVLPTAGSVQVTISGTRKAHGAQLQITDFGEAHGIATKIFEQLSTMLGQGQLISGLLRSELSSGAVIAIFGVVVVIIIVLVAVASQ